MPRIDVNPHAVLNEETVEAIYDALPDGDGFNSNVREAIRYLLNRDLLLSALEAGGVDNWDWYGESVQNAIEAGTLPEDY